MTPIKFHYSEEDIIQATQLAGRRIYLDKLPRFALFVVVFSAVMAALISWADSDLAQFPTLFLIICAVYLALAAVASFVTVTWVAKRKGRKSYKQIAMLRDQQELSWDEKTFSVSSDKGNLCFPFADIYRWSADGKSVLIYPGEAQFYPFPARIFFETQPMNEFVERLSQSGAPRL